MKIKTIEFENFRNFKERNLIRCSTDGKVTIVYGRNGDGKTTLHQLFQWAFYGQVHFNRTASDKMFNLELERDTPFGKPIKVWVLIEFEHDGNNYLLRREWIYKKGLDDSKKIGEDFTISKEDEDHNWNRLANPDIVIEQLIPSGLSEYFFFDGENMIADLRTKGHESAPRLKKALYSIFDLDLLESAVQHIGSTDLKTTVLGQLFLRKAASSSDNAVLSARAAIEQTEGKIAQLKEQLEILETEKKEKQEFITTASERIGGTKSKQEYERQRKTHRTNRDGYLNLADQMLGTFGAEVIRSYPRLLMARAIARSPHVITTQKENAVSIQGISRKLIESLLKSNTCLCGQPLTDEHYEHLRTFLKELPPYSFDFLYTQFVKRAKERQAEYAPEFLRECIVGVLSNREKAEAEDRAITELDEQEKGSDVALQALIDDRRKAELMINNELEPKIKKLQGQIAVRETQLRGQSKKFDEMTASLDSNKRAEARIQLVQAAKEVLEAQLQEHALEFSRRLEQEIQTLLNKMLTSKREVSVSPDFSMHVYDSFRDESKSEGQFAVVSFAYIGGILNLLKAEAALQSKEYPLVLDGPFSKLGLDHRQNVIDNIPDFAPQVIIFSKDDLQTDFPEDRVGHVYTIQSNSEKNVASVREGFLW